MASCGNYASSNCVDWLYTNRQPPPTSPNAAAQSTAQRHPRIPGVHHLYGLALDCIGKAFINVETLIFEHTARRPTRAGRTSCATSRTSRRQRRLVPWEPFHGSARRQQRRSRCLSLACVA